MAKDIYICDGNQSVEKVNKLWASAYVNKRAKQASLFTLAIPLAACGGEDRTVTTVVAPEEVAIEPVLRLVTANGVFDASSAVEQGGLLSVTSLEALPDLNPFETKQLSIPANERFIGDIALFSTSRTAQVDEAGISVVGTGDIWLIAPEAGFTGNVQSAELYINLAGGMLVFDMPSDAYRINIDARSEINLNGGTLQISDGTVFLSAAEYATWNVGELIVNSVLELDLRGTTLSNAEIEALAAQLDAATSDGNIASSVRFFVADAGQAEALFRGLQTNEDLSVETAPRIEVVLPGTAAVEVNLASITQSRTDFIEQIPVEDVQEAAPPGAIGANPNTSTLQIERTPAENDFSDAVTIAGAHYVIVAGDRFKGTTYVDSFEPGVTLLPAPPTFGGTGDDQVHNQQFEVYYGSYDDATGVFTVTHTPFGAPTLPTTHTLILYDNDDTNQVAFIEGLVFDGYMSEAAWSVLNPGTVDAVVVYTPAAGEIFGGPGDDTLTGTGANELIQGLGGDDTIDGDGGDDVIVGGAGADTLTGGAGADTFVNGDIDNNGTDSITDFATAVDNITLSIADLNALTGAATFTVGDGLVVNAGAFLQIVATSGGGVATAAATGTAGTFIYDSNTGNLIFDASGDTTYTDDGTGFTDANADDIVFADLGAGGLGVIQALDFTFIA